MTDERRKDRRYRFELEVEELRTNTRARTRDISLTGMFVRGLPARLLTRISLNIRFPDIEVPLAVTADVVRVERSGRDVAVKLVHPALASELHFEAHVRQLALAKTQPGDPPRF